MNLTMEIQNIKNITNLTIDFPLDKGLYAITGENGAGKSTLIACASTVFYWMPMNDYFGRPENASIKFTMGAATRGWVFSNKQWRSKSSDIKMKLRGFYEGSIIFGNRFKNTRFSVIRILDNLKIEDMSIADEFVRENLGGILHNDSDYYKELFILKRAITKAKKLTGDPYFYLTSKGELINQARMSTGENLLISILHSLNILYNKQMQRNDGWPCIVFLDEIELALHASALRRLVLFLKRIAKEIDLAIFFSTHSIELLREIKAQNIYYLQYNVDDSLSINNPCYPAYATRNLYNDDGYGNDMVILVEDDLAKLIIERILIEKNLLQNIRIKVLPTGGWTNTIIMAYDVLSSSLLMKSTKLAVVLDRDIKSEVPAFISNNMEYSGIKLDYLPIKSLEKFLRNNLFVKVNSDLFSLLDNYVFQKNPLNAILREYKRENKKDDTDGKILYGYLLNELRSMRKDREELIELVVKYIMKNETDELEELIAYLSEKIRD
mgnify:CR=1 FL=1